MDVDQYFLRGHQLTGSDLEDEDLRKGPWTADEDSILMDNVNAHGEGRWNSLAAHAGLRRSGKSCRLRWLNYLRPNVRRGNITLQEQLLILQLHSRWGNRWSKIAEYLPGRTDNEIKNYWRTRVQKQAKQLNCDVNSKQFQDAMRYVWIPRLMERVGASSSESLTSAQATATACPPAPQPEYCQLAADSSSDQYLAEPNLTPETSGTSSNSSGHQDFSNNAANPTSSSQLSELDYCPASGSTFYRYGQDTAMGSSDNWLTPGGDPMENLWNEENIWFLQQQLNSDE